MPSSSPAACTSTQPNTEASSKKVQWAPGTRRLSSTDSESRASRVRRPSRLTVKYDRGQLQSWLETEQWVDAQLQELFQDHPTLLEPEIDLEVLMDLSTEEQKPWLQDILRDSPHPTETFISELLSRLKKLRRLSRPQK
ncbi:protein phosphatase 1 regulatory subunit 14D [Sorex fumeus]|uniref:protein phosphatase 1 regulatory subunit 14D n=1 Tax=Sorex fumeus TaxID=62283 RepID=UPI0024AE5093|nr:protein phosphatase 1 regulatory subunit 14D [Sorex fumeus]